MLTKNTYKDVYRTYRDSIDKDFYVPCFAESVALYRAVGFFSLHSLALSIDGLIRFIRKNGTIQLICSPEISQTDAELIDSCISLDKEHVTKSLINTITGSKLSEDELDQLDIICNMLCDNKLTIKVAFQPLGIYHEKFGIFEDEEENRIYFNGSMNETVYGLLHNHESIFVLQSWNSEHALGTISHELNYFKELWNGEDESVVVIDFPEAVKQNLLLSYQRSQSLEEAIDNYIRKNSRPEKKSLYSYQKNAIKQFCENGYHHFYEMATGTGKTFTAIKTIEALRDERPEKKFVVVVVPQIDLQTQWESALREDGYEKIFLFGGEGPSFEQTIAEATIAFFTDEKDVICVAVYDTFFSKVYTKLQRTTPLFIIVDEAHNLTKGNLAILKQLNPEYRLGLSATIQRFCEEESLEIARFFTPKETFYYGIEDAIENKFLSEYEYHPIFVHLTEDENERFQLKSKFLAQELNKNKEDQDPEVIDKLRRERSLILKQATAKPAKLNEMAMGDYNFVNSVVYCGQGKDEDGEKIIDSVTRILYDNNLVVSQFTSNTKDRKRVLFEFEHGYFDTLVAIKCFDEGVDVPKLDKIYIMASDSALRQTVQRRGRVLRKCKETGKTIAHIYDMLVLPAIEAGTYGSDSLLKIELSRAREYNRLALNKEVNEQILQELENEYHVTINEATDYDAEPD